MFNFMTAYNMHASFNNLKKLNFKCFVLNNSKIFLLL